MPRLPGIDKSGAQIGEIIAIGHDASVPPGTLLCDGNSYLRTDYPALFNAIGTRWGTADGTHFNVPNFKGVFLRGHANGSTNDPDRASRTTSATGGASGDAVGSFQTHQYASHSHTVTPPLAAMEGVTFRLKMATTNNRTRSLRRRTRRRWTSRPVCSAHSPVFSFVNSIPPSGV